ncbi:MAG: hypothetical protein ACYTFK_06930 [Planctomycetota bacterium]|jgi:hypothetical protein
MNKSQKIAIFLITVIILQTGLGFYARFRPSFNFGLGPPTTGIVICVLVLLTVSGTFYRNIWANTYDVLKRNKTKILLDERDLSILKEAELAGFIGSYVFFVLTCMICWLVTKKEGTISSHALGTIVAGGYLAYEFFRSIAILALYGRGRLETPNKVNHK